MRTRPSTFCAFRQDFIDLFRSEKPVRIPANCATPMPPHRSLARGGWVLVTMVLPGKLFYCRYGFRYRRSAAGDGQALSVVASQMLSEQIGPSYISNVTPSFSSCSYISCPCPAIYFPPPFLPINTCLYSKLAHHHQGTCIAALRGELSHPELSCINSGPGLGSVG